MAYRTYIDGFQIFGNNDWFKEYEDFIKANGIELGPEGQYDGYITDVKGLFEVIDTITRKLIKEQHERVEKGETDWEDKPVSELADFSRSMWLNEKTPILYFNIHMIGNTYIFLPYQTYLAIKDKLEPCEKPYVTNSITWATCSYQLKEGEKIHVYAC